MRDLKFAIRARHAIPFFQQRILQVGESQESDDDGMIMSCRHATLVREEDVVKGRFAYLCRSRSHRRDYLAPDQPSRMRGLSRVWSMRRFVEDVETDDPGLDTDYLKRLRCILVEALTFAGFEE
jgi:hypothetical protein